MLLTDYRPDELRFAFCSHAYVRWRTYRRRSFPPLARLDRPALQALAERFGLHCLEGDSRPTEVRLLLSLRPQETTAAAVSKLKGQVSKWLREALGQQQPAHLLGRGYFACTSGKSTRPQVEAYLDGQGEHHGYARRVRPPVYTQTYRLEPEHEATLQAPHSWTV
jgi:REP element-mobilizing transposase RayT